VTTPAPFTERNSRGWKRRTTIERACAALFCLAAFVVGSTASAATPSDTTLQRDTNTLVAGGAPGAVLLVRNGKTTTRLTSGVADLETKTPIVAADHYRIVNLGDTVQRWLPGVLRNGDKITIRLLLNHTSGLYDHERDPEVLKPYLNGDLGYFWAPIRLVKLADSRPAHYAPGHTKVSTYSSTNYSVLGLVVRAVTWL
jgi:D-alanyl-D-alanine carboxypeptidase